MSTTRMLIAVAAAKSAFTAFTGGKVESQHFGRSKAADSTDGAKKSPQRENKAARHAER